jgi:hypothetical protein
VRRVLPAPFIGISIVILFLLQHYLINNLSQHVVLDRYSLLETLHHPYRVTVEIDLASLSRVLTLYHK